MKDLITLVTRDDVHDFMSKLWRSAEFRKSYDERGFVYDQVERFAWLPRMFAQSTNDYLERAHFSTWWNVIMIREYENDVVHDLYYLHEMTHAATMPYVPHIGRAAFREKMQRSELEASVLSEIVVYLEMPTLRSASFDHEIYADRFLESPEIKALWESNREVAIESLRVIRRDVMMDKSEEQMSLTERWIRRFAEQNEAYAIVWSDRYDDVEIKMAQLQIDSHKDRAAAIIAYRAWLEEETARDPVDGIPFRQESELFSPFYWTNKAKYDAAMSK